MRRPRRNHAAAFKADARLGLQRYFTFYNQRQPHRDDDGHASLINRAESESAEARPVTIASRVALPRE